jgi:hypothetical protein
LNAQNPEDFREVSPENTPFPAVTDPETPGVASPNPDEPSPSCPDPADRDRTIAVLRDALELFLASGDNEGAANAMRTLAEVLLPSQQRSG